MRLIHWSVFLAACAAITPVAHASTMVRVTPDQASELQSMIDGSTDDLTLFLEPGVYGTCLEIGNGKTVSLIAAQDDAFEAACGADSPSTILSCDGLNTLTVEGEANLLGLTLRNSDRGRVLLVDDGVVYGQDLVLEPDDAYIGANEDGAAIAVERDDAEVFLTHSVIRNLMTDNNGGALSIDDGRVQILDSHICGTQAYHGGAVYMSGSTDSTPTLLGVNLAVTGTVATGDGGAFYAGAKASLQLVEGSVTDANASNTYSKGGALYIYPSADRVRMTDVHILNNEAGYGGGAYVENGDGFAAPIETGFEFYHGSMEGNMSGLHGGGLFVDDGYAVLSAVTMVDNHAYGSGVGYGGGAMIVEDGFLESWGVTWQNNVAGNDEGLVGAEGEGAAVFVDEGYWVAVDDLWEGNTVVAGGGSTLEDGACGPEAGVAGSLMYAGFPPIIPNETCFASGTLTDGDGDGFAGGGSLDALGQVLGADCNDARADIYPGAEDIPYDGIDQNCDGADDDDVDGDGHRSAADTVDGDDCDDSDRLVGPHAVDRPYDGVDTDCDEADDFDADGDGYRSAEETDDGLDCDDLNESINPLAPEVHYDGIDQDCFAGNEYDADGDGEDHEDYGGLDCDDNDASVGSFAEEIFYDEIDNDCDGTIGWDRDGDGFDGCCTLDQIAAGECDPYDCDDCDDNDATVNPSMSEIDDAVDHDCDGAASPYDSDGDGVNDYWEEENNSDPNDEDSDNDLIPDGVEWGDPNGNPVDTDKDGVPDVLDTDSDNDSVEDRIERDDDHDGDGTPDYRDSDDDDDGLPTIDEYQGGVDTDGDGVSDYLDPDSDNDSVIDGADPNPLSPGGNYELTPEKNRPSTYGFGCATGSTSPTVAWWLISLALIGRRFRQREA